MLAAQFVLSSHAQADPASATYATTLLEERWRWEWVTFDWYGAGKLSMGMMDFALVWLVAAGTQLTRPVTPVTG